MVLADQAADLGGYGLRRVGRWARQRRRIDRHIRRQLLAMQEPLDLAPAVALLVARLDVGPRAVEGREVGVDVSLLRVAQFARRAVALDIDQRFTWFRRSGRGGALHNGARERTDP